MGSQRVRWDLGTEQQQHEELRVYTAYRDKRTEIQLTEIVMSLPVTSFSHCFLPVTERFPEGLIWARQGHGHMIPVLQ